ncbi:MAG: putative ABC transport system permease protein [Saprospiraceae bacterium]|jgi:putative ABC transport system permease protein
MLDRDTWQEIFSTIRKNKLRSFLTALGVFWGIFMLVFLLGMGNGLETGVYRNFGSRAKNIMMVWSWRMSMPYKGLAPGRRIKLYLDDANAVEANIPGVKGVAARYSIGDRNVVYGSLNGNYEIDGVYPLTKHVEGYVLDEGRFINKLDMEEGRKVAVLGRTAKNELFGDSLAVGKHVIANGIDFQVVGVFAKPSAKEWDLEDMESLLVPITTLYKAYGVESNRIGQLIVEAEPGVAVSSIEPKVRALLAERKMVSPDDEQALRGFNLEQEFKDVQNLFLGIKGLLWFVGIGTLISGIVGVSNIMLITVKERTKEIGIRKAMGATPNSIISMILTESIFITSIAGYLGLMFGTFLIIGLNYLMVANGVENENFYNPKVNLTIAVSALVFLVVSGTIAGLIPAMQAARVNPVDALKDE